MRPLNTSKRRAATYPTTHRNTPTRLKSRNISRVFLSACEAHVGLAIIAREKQVFLLFSESEGCVFEVPLFTVIKITNVFSVV